jgi:hypothetical protein
MFEISTFIHDFLTEIFFNKNFLFKNISLKGQLFNAALALFVHN